MIHRAEVSGHRFPWMASSNRRLDRRELAVLPIGILDHEARIDLKFFGNRRRIRSEHHSRDADPRMARRLHQMCGKSGGSIGQQCFWAVHAPGFRRQESRRRAVLLVGLRCQSL